MGCVSSKGGVPVTPAVDHSGLFKADRNAASRRTNSGRRKQETKKDELAASGRGLKGGEVGELVPSNNVEPSSFRLGNLQKCIEGEQVAAGWPAWLSSVAAEAIQGWVPLRADSYEKLEKIGQGTYSSVFRARDLDTGKIVALKKVRFDNFEPESVRFMAREIMILRRLDHPNVMKLEGLITSRLSCSMFLVFEYMEHDITGLLSCPDVNFTEPQIKCYMKQLLSGLEHCHTRGVMHRDIKGSNLLVNNEGVLKVADFGLANFCFSKQPLTSRVVTLWYRPPELLLGATDYGTSVDLWSVGSVFAEILTRKPVLQGRTEVEQIHKIFKLCGSPPEEYWERSRLPHSTIFKPNQPYESCLRETFRDFPTTAVDLLETLLSVEPHKRGTASTALASEYFNSSPYACEASSLPKYPPSKEIDVKNRKGAGRKKSSGARTRGPDIPKRPSGKPNGTNKLAPLEESIQPLNKEADQKACSNGPMHSDITVTLVNKTTGGTEAPKGGNTSSQLNSKDVPLSGPLEISSSSGFAWAKKPKDEQPTSFLPRYHSRSISKSHIFNVLEPMPPNSGKTNSSKPSGRGCYDFFEDTAVKKKQRARPFGHPNSFDASENEYHSHELSRLYQKDGPVASHDFLGYSLKANQVDFSGPLLSQKYGMDELLEKNERHIRHATRKSWFQKDKKEAK